MPVKMRPELIPNLRAEKKVSAWLKVHIPAIWMLESGMPVSSKSQLFAAQRSMWGRGVAYRGDREMILCGNPAWRNCCTTSSPTSKASTEILGPIMALQCWGEVLYWRVICWIACCAIRLTVPRHPAWIAAIAWCTSSNIRMGTQSAVEMPMHCCGKLVIRASMSCNRATCSVADLTRTMCQCVER